MHFKSSHRKPQGRSACTLMQLGAVSVAIVMLGLLLILAIGYRREMSRKDLCANNLREIGIGINSYCDANDGAFPPGQWLSPSVPDGEPFSWCVEILPHINEQQTWDQFDFDKDLLSAENSPAAGKIIEIFLCPSSDPDRGWRNGENRIDDLDQNGELTPEIGEGMACIDYMGVAGPTRTARSMAGTDFGRNRGILLAREIGDLSPPQVQRPNGMFDVLRRSHVTDGLSRTICVAESTSRSAFFDAAKGKWELSGTWASGENISHVETRINETGHLPDYPGETDQEEIYSDHRGGAFVLFANGSAMFLDEGLERDILHALCTRNGESEFGEDLSDSDWPANLK